MPQPMTASLPLVREIEHVWIPLADGVRLSARIWLPVDVSANRPVPAILEYLPYRKDDATAAADASRHPYFAARGYAGVRVDLRGTGSSEGLCLGEYLPQEQDDALEVLAWLAEQPWCTGAVGMIGYSWGGFNGLQVAAHAPEQLRAVISIHSTDDRYTDDCHYQGGCVLGSDLLKWASWMHAFDARPPDPRFAGDSWRREWLERLRGNPPMIDDWIAHQRRDDFWRQGSVAEDYSAIVAPVLAVGGWTDAYTNAVPRLLEHLTCPRRGIIGPWGHVMPSHGVPGPAIGFLQECVAWFDRWLKDIENGADKGPLLRAYLQESMPAADFIAARPGHWIAEDAWPPASVSVREVALPLSGTIVGDQRCGETAGVWCANGMPYELPIDQRADDARSLLCDLEPLATPLDLLGHVRVRLALSVDRPCALVAVRLCDVAPDGSSTLVTWGQLNLTHRDSDAEPEPLGPDRRYETELALNVIGQHIPAGHRLRVAVSPTNWPHAWPSPAPVALTLFADGCSMSLPVRTPQAADAEPLAFGPPEESVPVTGEIRVSGDRTRERSGYTDSASALDAPGAASARRGAAIPADKRVACIEDRQSYRANISATGTDYAETGVDRWRITADDPLSARVECDREISIDREGWHVRLRTEGAMWSDAGEFHVTSALMAWDGGELVFEGSWQHAVPRDLV